ncbi:MAG: diguanylate cyclase, partial [Wenzhouxiangella sp.]|nr:diguanylate cyclase [Wenzhouxiangella sp.]
EITEDPFGFIWFAGDTDGILRFDSEEWVVWSDGLIENNTRSNISTVAVSDDGRLWVGSWGNGLQYWDTELQRFVQFLPDPSNPHALAADRVQRLRIDNQGRLWIGTTAGINLIDPEQPNVIRRLFHDQPDHPLYRARIWGMAEHASGFWFATSNGLYRLSPDLSEWTHLLLDEQAAEQFERGAEVRTVAIAHGQVWAGSQLGVFRWNPNSDELVRVEFDDQPDRPMPRINAILESANGDIWAGAHDGLYQIDEQTRQYVALGDNHHLLPDVDIRTLYEDSEGNLWIGSRDRGIIQGKRVDRVFQSLAEDAPPEFRDEASRLISSVLNDRSNRIWLGVPGGLLRRDQDGQWSSWTFPTEINVRRVDALAEDTQGTIWIATDSGLFKIGDDDRLETDSRVFEALGIGTVPVNSVIAAEGDTLLLGLWSYGVVHWRPETNEIIEIGLEQLQDIRADLTYQITRDDSGEFWASTRYSGVFSSRSGNWQPVSIRHNDQEHAPTKFCVHHQPIGVLWLCTEDGLLRYSLETRESEVLDATHGLPTNRITGLINDDDTGLWVLTTRGVARRMPEENRFVSYGLADGLPSLAIQRNAIDKLADGRLIIGTSDGAVVVDPSSATRGLNSPRTVLSRLWLDGEELTRSVRTSALKVELPYQHRELIFQFAVLDFHEPAGNLIRYRLNNYDSDFTELSSNRTARFMNLPPGDYTLEVEGWSSRGVPGDRPLEIPITVAAPWWYSPLVWLAALLLLASMVWITIQLRLRALNNANERLQSLVAERTEALASANERLKASSERDFLTKLLNRRGFSSRFGDLCDMAVRGNRHLSVVLFDLDYFKQINDNFGHDTGDEILAGIGNILKDDLRGPDLAARWGGEEFLLALPDTDTEGAIKVCRKITQSLSHLSIPSAPELDVTATFGVVSRQASNWPLEHWVKAADQALYTGKNSGRDQIKVHEADGI